MTANQISYAMSQESIRHNTNVESLEDSRNQETERHNKEIEKLEGEKLRIQEIYNSQMTNLKQSELEHRKYVDELSLQIQKEQGEAKIALQQQLNDITELYNQQKVALESEANATKEALKDIEASKLAETIRYNDMLASFKVSDIELQKWVTDKKLQYDYHKLDVESGLSRRNLQLTEARDIFNFGLATKDYELRRLLTTGQVSNLEAQTKLAKSNRFWNPIRNMSESFANIGKGLKYTMSAGNDVVNMLKFGGF